MIGATFRLSFRTKNVPAMCGGFHFSYALGVVFPLTFYTEKDIAKCAFLEHFPCCYFFFFL